MENGLVCIIGSCVTRDVWRIVGANTDNLHYFARTSLISQMSPPIQLLESEIPLLSSFRRFSVLVDAQRSAISWIKTYKSRALILDFIDDRVDILDLEGRYLLATDELHDSGVISSKFQSARIVSRLSSECYDLWLKSVELFQKFMMENSPETLVFLHKARFAKLITDGNSEELFESIDYIDSRNNLMRNYEASFLDSFPDLKVLEPSSDFCLSSKTHTWGVSPIHYINNYYFDLWRLMQKYDLF